VITVSTLDWMEGKPTEIAAYKSEFKHAELANIS
jgi:hypothetical protein